jgi:predicted nicotinamide N-methyase
VTIAEVTLNLLRPADPDELLDEEAFENDEFLPYWAQLWPSALELAEVLPTELEGVRVVEIGCGLGVPALIAAVRGAIVTATDWASDAVDLLRTNAVRNDVSLDVRQADWRSYSGQFDLALAADVLYEERNVAPLLALLPELAPVTLLADPGRPHARMFFAEAEKHWNVAPVAQRVSRLERRVE